MIAAILAVNGLIWCIFTAIFFKIGIKILQRKRLPVYRYDDFVALVSAFLGALCVLGCWIILVFLFDSGLISV